MPARPEDGPQGYPSRHVAGVRLADGRQMFVEHVPDDLVAGTTIHLHLDGQELEGRVSIPPSLIAWRDPGARCAAFGGVVALPPSVRVDPGALPETLYLSEQDAPDEMTLAAMLALARDDLHRLDD